MPNTLPSKTQVIHKTTYWYECHFCGQSSTHEETPENAWYYANQEGAFCPRGYWYCDRCLDHDEIRQIIFSQP